MPISRKKRIALLLVGAACSLLVLNSCVDPIPETSSSDRPSITGERIVTEHYSPDDGRKIWRLEAEQVELFEISQETIAEIIALEFYDEDGAVALSMSADHLVYFMGSGDLSITGNINAKEASGIHLTTEEAYWEDESGILRGESPVQAERKDLSVSATGFAYDPSRKVFSISDGELEVLVGSQND